MLDGDVCFECGAPAETVWGESFVCMPHACDLWDELGRRIPKDASDWDVEVRHG